MRIIFLCLILLFVSTACTTTVPLSVGTHVSWQEHQRDVAQLQYWTLQGRLAVTNGSESWHLDMSWQQQGDNYIIKLFVPFGAGQIQLRGDHNGVVLDDGENTPLYADNADSLLYESTGLKIPVEGLRYWVRGLPDPGMSNGEMNLSAGKLKQLHQGGWQLRFRRYQQVNNTSLPQKLFLHRDDLDVRLVIDQWQLGLVNS